MLILGGVCVWIGVDMDNMDNSSMQTATAQITDKSNVGFIIFSEMWIR